MAWADMPPVHPAAELFPLMPVAEFVALMEDIRTNGQFDPIVMHQGAILDGRHRYRACQQLRIEPRTVKWDGEGGSPGRYVLAVNLRRRHLTVGQQALIVVSGDEFLEEEDKARARKRAGTVDHLANLPDGAERSNSRDFAAKLADVSPRTVQDAKKVRDKGCPALIAAVKADAVSVSAAAQVADLPWKEQAAAVRTETVAKKATETRLKKRAARSRGDLRRKVGMDGTGIERIKLVAIERTRRAWLRAIADANEATMDEARRRGLLDAARDGERKSA